MTAALTEQERREALEAARWYVTGVISELSANSVSLLVRLALELHEKTAPPQVRSPRVFRALPKAPSP